MFLVRHSRLFDSGCALQVENNALECVPPELADLQALERLDVRPFERCSSRLTALPLLQLPSNQLSWLPFDLERLPAATVVWVMSLSFDTRCLNSLFLRQVHYNPLPLSFTEFEDVRPRLNELFAATTHIGMIRARAATICFAMQDLELPAPLTLEILDALMPNSIRMWAKWELITAVKHFHQRHERAGRTTND
jgi:hypothetical protein